MSAYRRLSGCRPELMGFAALWVMLFHAYHFKFGFFPLDAFKQIGFAGVDIFILLSAMGLYVSLSRTEKPSLTQFYLRRALLCCPRSGWQWGCTGFFPEGAGGADPRRAAFRPHLFRSAKGRHLR